MLMSSSHEIFALRKAKRNEEALAMARATYAENARDPWFLRAYAWTLFDRVSLEVARYEQKELSPAAMSGKVSGHLREFCKFARPLSQEPVFSQMVRLAVKASKDWKDFLAFAQWAGLACFSQEDKKPFTTQDGKAIDSLEKRFLRAVCRETVVKAADPMANAIANVKATAWGEGVLDHALRQDPQDHLLNYYRSKLHWLRHETAQAITRLLPVLRRQPRVAWTWSLLGAIMESMGAPGAITCYAHATQLARQEQEVAKTRLHLARLLAEAGRWPEAGWEVCRAIDYRAHNALRHPPELVQLSGSDWFQDGLQASRFQAVPEAAASVKALLRELGHQRLAYRLGVVDHVNADKRLTFVATGVDSGWVLMHARFAGSAALTPGSVVELGFDGQDEPPVHWPRSAATEMAGLCEILEGQLDHQEGKPFAFIRTPAGDVFVAPELLPECLRHPTGMLRCQAMWRMHKKTGKASWRALGLMDKA